MVECSICLTAKSSGINKPSVTSNANYTSSLVDTSEGGSTVEPIELHVSPEFSCQEHQYNTTDQCKTDNDDFTDPGQWSCTACTFVNDPMLIECSVCMTPRRRSQRKTPSHWSTSSCESRWRKRKRPTRRASNSRKKNTESSQTESSCSDLDGNDTSMSQRRSRKRLHLDNEAGSSTESCLDSHCDVINEMNDNCCSNLGVKTVDKKQEEDIEDESVQTEHVEMAPKDEQLAMEEMKEIVNHNKQIELKDEAICDLTDSCTIEISDSCKETNAGKSNDLQSVSNSDFDVKMELERGSDARDEMATYGYQETNKDMQGTIDTVPEIKLDPELFKENNDEMAISCYQETNEDYGISTQDTINTDPKLKLDPGRYKGNNNEITASGLKDTNNRENIQNGTLQDSNPCLSATNKDKELLNESLQELQDAAKDIFGNDSAIMDELDALEAASSCSNDCKMSTKKPKPPPEPVSLMFVMSPYTDRVFLYDEV